MLCGKVRSKTTVPVPKVLAWNSEPNSVSVGTEYIIMEHVPGIALKETWSKMNNFEHIDLIERMGGLVEQLCALDFGAFSRLYLNTANKLPNSNPIDGKYRVGPPCGRQFRGYNDDQIARAAVSLDLQGPCKRSKHNAASCPY